MQGEQLQAEVIRALQAHLRSGVDVVVITRGGGSRADLSWFDQKDLAVAIAESPVPVITAIGHEIDRSIADLVAHHFCKTPTAAAEFLVDRVDLAAGRLDDATARLQDTLEEILSEARLRLEVADRIASAARGFVLEKRIRIQQLAGRFQNLVTAQLIQRERRLAGLETQLVSCTVGTLAQASSRIDRLGLRVATASVSRLDTAHDRRRDAARRLVREVFRPLQNGKRTLDGLATQARLLDPERLLKRGYTLTLDSRGKALISAKAVSAGDHIRTRFADGEVASIVQPDDKRSGSSGSSRGKGKKSGGKGKKENPGQETLFR